MYGALPDQLDERDYQFERPLGAATVDWVKGFDIRSLLGGDIKIKNQYSSSSCVGQGTSYYAWVLQVLETAKEKGMTLEELKENYPDLVEEISAKAIYSQITLGKDQGAYLRDGVKLIVNWGGLFEKDVKSYKDDGTTDELFMIDTKWKTPELEEKAKALRGKEYRVASDCNIDSIALAIMQGYGVLGGVFGSNNGTWSTVNPKPPAEGESTWGHAIYFGAFGTDEKGKFIATPNSWGALFGKWDGTVGSGWQKLRENYFDRKYMFNPWTLVDKDNDLASLAYIFTKDLYPNMSENDIDEVKMLQKVLRHLGFYNDPMNTMLGYFGNNTEQALKEFQQAHSLKVTGIVDMYTRAKLNSLIN